MKVRLLESVTWNYTNVEPGEVVDLPEKSAKALIEEGKAEAAEEQPPADPNAGSATGGEDTTPEQPTAGDGDVVDPEEERAKLTTALDKLKRDELADKAKELGIEFKYDAKKGDVIDAVIDAGKAALFIAE